MAYLMQMLAISSRVTIASVANVLVSKIRIVCKYFSKKSKICKCLSKRSKIQKFAWVSKNHFFRAFFASVRKRVCEYFGKGEQKITFCDFWSNLSPKISMRKFLQNLSKITICELFARFSKIHFLRFYRWKLPN